MKAPSNLPAAPSWTNVPIPSHLTGEARILAEHYRHMVWKVASEYRRKSYEQPKTGKNELVSAALGQHSRQPSMCVDEDTYCSTFVKFPSRQDEVESIQLFRRAGGPLAATFSGREKLSRENKRVYGDGRPLRYCRVGGCQMVHEEQFSGRYMCDWHNKMVGSQWANKTLGAQRHQERLGGGKRKHDETVDKMAELKAYTRSRNETLKNSAAATARNSLPKKANAMLSEVQRKIAAATAAAVSSRVTADPAKMSTSVPAAAAPTMPPHPIMLSKTIPSQNNPPVISSTKPSAFVSKKMGKLNNSDSLWQSSNDSKRTSVAETKDMAAETPLGPADADVEEFMHC